MVIARIQHRVRMSIARAGLSLLKRSGCYEGYWSHWRGTLWDEAQAMGMHLMPVHYYSPVPNTAAIDINDGEPRFPVVTDDELDAALALWDDLAGRYPEKSAEFLARKDISDGRFAYPGAPYAAADVEALYGWIRSQRPRRIIEIGSGFTTLLINEAIADATEDDASYRCALHCVEPYLPDYLKPAPAHVTEVIGTPLQDVPLELFEGLEAGDLLFIDSTHVLNYGSDVVYEYLKLLPLLKPGVVVHIHDIFLPYDYPNHWMRESRFLWNEQYLLAAQIQAGSRYKPILPMHQLYRERLPGLRARVPHVGHLDIAPAAFWLEIS